ncbi:uncharacterized protein LOC117124638 [Anneissia japonica]|uniref:uncharacterized protein LOC117124638 n=1 Tax=Anneissia japonica TaxID=1529436 RepID=UPI001425647A|nr:uncharacterized protein LOC117124638 [Anneissia japonica]
MQQESMFSGQPGKQKHVRLKSPTISQQSVLSHNDSLEGIESLKNSSVHPPGTDDIYTDDESVKSFRSGESMDMKPESATFDSVMSEQQGHTSLSLQLKDIEKKCRTEHGSSELTKGLAKMLPKSIEQDKELKQLRTLRVATMDQHQRFKDEIEEKNQMIGDLR